jgi:1-acyl-sn-glycerol-3-phosphate acyltransferase
MDPVPGRDGPRPTLAQRLARWVLSLFGWRVAIEPPPVPRCVIIVYPHTSNWDFPIGYLAKVAAGLWAHFVGKDTLFRWPLGALLRRMGGIPVNRREPTGLVGQLAAEMARRPRMWLVIAPEGTRRRTDHWKSGFYRLALAAGVPLGLAYIDYRTRTAGLDTYLELTGNEEVDLGRMRAFYAGKVGLRPEHASDIRFRAHPPRPSS